MGAAKYKVKDSYPGIVCHVYNRGVNKQKVFIDENDFAFYLKKAREYKEKYNIDILCYNFLV
jgi:hypothetical protein